MRAGWKRKLEIIVVTVTALAGMSPLMAGEPHKKAGFEVQLPLPPAVRHVKVAAARLHFGMTGAEVHAIMGNASTETHWVDGGTAFSRLTFPAGPIAAKVTLKHGKVSSIALDVFKIESGNLPAYSRRAWPGMHISAMRFALGAPSAVRHHRLFGIKLEQLIFQHAGEPNVSVFFAADRVIAKAIGEEIPPGIFHTDLPLPPNRQSGQPSRFAQPGMPVSDVAALYGGEKLHAGYKLNGHSAAHVIYAAREGQSFASVTFVDGILTEIEELGNLSDAVFQAG